MKDIINTIANYELHKRFFFLLIITSFRKKKQAWLPRFCAVGQRQGHLGGSDELKKLINAEKVKRGSSNRPTDSWTEKAGCRVA